MPFYSAYKSLSHYPDYWYWNLRGRPRRTPHLLKQRALLEYAERYGLRTLIETGTYYGEMVAALKNSFLRIYSVECDHDLVQNAIRKFEGERRIRILEGESQVVVPELLKSLTEPALFWLDAGYYTWDGLPRNQQRLSIELEAILNHTIKGHVVLVDDASTLKYLRNSQDEVLTPAEFESRVAARFPGRAVEVKHDILRITPQT